MCATHPPTAHMVHMFSQNLPPCSNHVLLIYDEESIIKVLQVNKPKTASESHADAISKYCIAG